MKNSRCQANRGRVSGLKVVAALAFTIVISGLTVTSAFAKENDDEHGWRRDRHEQHDHRQREWRGDREGYGYRPEYRRPYTYAQPVYVPPPVYYEPRQSPGINLFFPLEFRR